MMFRHPHAPGGHGPNGIGPIVAGCPDCNRPEAIAARRARRDLERGTATFAAPVEIDDRPGFPGCTDDAHAPGCPCLAGGDVVPADPDGWLPAPPEPEWTDAPAGAGDDVEAFRG